MNKKEFIETLIDMGGCGAKPGTWARGWDDAISEVIENANKLDEPKKPVIPQFVANEIERYENMLDMLSGEYFNNSSEEIDDDGLLVWIDENQDTFARAWLDGYEVEKEKKYYVLDHEGETMLYKVLSQGVAKTSGCKPSEVGNFLSRDYTFTESEIKAVDERYWAFAFPVEEVTE